MYKFNMLRWIPLIIELRMKWLTIVAIESRAVSIGRNYSMQSSFLNFLFYNILANHINII